MGRSERWKEKREKVKDDKWYDEGEERLIESKVKMKWEIIEVWMNYSSVHTNTFTLIRER